MIIIMIYIYIYNWSSKYEYIYIYTIYIYICYEWKETHGHEPQTNWQLFFFFVSHPKLRGRSGIWRTRWRVLRSCNLQGSPTLRRRRSLGELVNSPFFFWRFLITKKKIIKRKTKAMNEMKHGSFWCHLFLKPLGLVLGTALGWYGGPQICSSQVEVGKCMKGWPINIAGWFHSFLFWTSPTMGVWSQLTFLSIFWRQNLGDETFPADLILLTQTKFAKSTISWRIVATAKLRNNSRNTHAFFG